MVWYGFISVLKKVNMCVFVCVYMYTYTHINTHTYIFVSSTPYGSVEL